MFERHPYYQSSLGYSSARLQNQQEYRQRDYEHRLQTMVEFAQIDLKEKLERELEDKLKSRKKLLL